MKAMHTTYTGRKMHQSRSTWLGRPGQSYDSSKSNGLRIHVQLMDDSDTACVKVIAGDGRHDDDFLELDRIDVPASDWERVVESFAGVYNAISWPR